MTIAQVIALALFTLYSINGFSQSILAQGRLESFAFEFVVNNPQELKDQCLVFAQEQNIAHIDDIYISFNGNKRLHLHHQDGVWHYPQHFCNELMFTAQNVDLTPPTSTQYQEISATIMREEYKFTGHHQASLFNDCIEQLESTQLVEADRIKLSLNNGEWINLFNHDEWWKGAQRICSIIDQAIFHQRISRAPALE